ncbi:MAG: efflux RND transporter periplasmic adaptor subunit [Taibaiella sp.]
MRTIPGILICILATLLVTGCRNESKKAQTEKPKQDSTLVFILKKESFDKEVSFPGELIPLERAEITAKIAGYVRSIKADIGDRVQKGQVLVMLEAPEMISNYTQTNADLQSARSRYLGSLDAYKRILHAARVEGTVALGEMEKYKTQMLSDSAAYQSVKSRLNSVGQLNDYLTIRAPYSGIITQRNIDPGTLVGTGSTKPMLIIENNSSLRLRLPVPEAYTAATPENALVSFTVDAYPGKLFEAKLSRKSGALNLTNRTETWEFIYNNKNHELKSGMFANASIKFARPAPTFFVPATAVATNLEKRFVIRVKDGKADWVDVRNGINVNDRQEIFGNLNEGDTLLVRATDEIKAGTVIERKSLNK